MSSAALILSASGVDAIDINLGCPQGIARKGNYGAYLLPQVSLVCSIIKAMKTATDTPVTVKVRCLDTSEGTLENVRMLEDAGVDMIAVHGRTVKETKTRQGPVNLDVIKAVVEQSKVPVIANGGIELSSDAHKVLEATGACGVMSSEGLLENPGLFGGGCDDTDMTPAEVRGAEGPCARKRRRITLRECQSASEQRNPNR